MLDLNGAFASFLNSLAVLLSDVLGGLFGFLESLINSVVVAFP